MKKFISILLSVVISLGVMSSCGHSLNEDALTMGDWLIMVTDSFGIKNVSNKTSYIENVKNTDYAFDAFQKAVEWGIIEPDKNISSGTLVTWNEALISLVNAGEFVKPNTDDKNKIKFAIDNFDNSIRDYWGNRYIELKDAVPLLDKAQKLWANKKFTKKVEKVEFSKKVKNFIDKKDLNYKVENNNVVLDSEYAAQLKKGDVYVLPANQSNSSSINKVKNIKTINNKKVIENEENFTSEEASKCLENVKIQETVLPDFTKIGGVLDENGNPIDYKIEQGNEINELSNNNNYEISTLENNFGNSDLVQTGIFDNSEGNLSFKVKDYTVGLKLKNNSVKVELSKSLKKKSNRYRSETQEVYGSVSFNDVEITKDIDFSWGILHSATVKMDYKTVVEGGIKNKREGKIGNPVQKGKETVKSLKSTIKQYKNSLETLKKDVRNSKCHEDIYICKLPLLGNSKIAGLDFVIKGKVSAEGSVKIVFSLEGSQGIEYKNGKLRYINSKDIDVDFLAEANIETTVAPGLEVSLFGKISVVELSIEGGLGASVGMTSHLFDAGYHEIFSSNSNISIQDAEELAREETYVTPEELQRFAKEAGGDLKIDEMGANIQIKSGTCLDWSVYPILRFGIDPESLIGTLAKGLNFTLQSEFLGSKNTLLKGHIDLPKNLSSAMNSSSISKGISALLGIGAECTYDFKPWDKALDGEKSNDKNKENVKDINKNLIESDRIVLSTMKITVEEGKSASIIVEALPKGYSYDDLIAKCDNTDIATFDKNNTYVTGKKEGTTQIVVKTKDGKYKSHFAVTVISESENNSEEI